MNNKYNPNWTIYDDLSKIKWSEIVGISNNTDEHKLIRKRNGKYYITAGKFYNSSSGINDRALIDHFQSKLRLFGFLPQSLNIQYIKETNEIEISEKQDAINRDNKQLLLDRDPSVEKVLSFLE